jgi:hypothetical protein
MIKNFNQYNISENLKYHLEGGIPISENIFRFGSESFFDLIRECRSIYNKDSDIFIDGDKFLLENTDFGEFGYYGDELVALDIPLFIDDDIYESGGKKLNKPQRSSGPKKYKVYVKHPKTGNIKCVHFGDKKGGLTAKIKDPAARKSFVARHKCEDKIKRAKVDKMVKLTPGYWSCVLPRYSNALGMGPNKNYLW